MSELPNPVNELLAFRRVLVNARRETISQALSLRIANDAPEDSGSGASWGADLQRIQEQIDSVDRAIDDERIIAKKPR